MIHNDRLNRLRRTSRAGHRRVRWDIRSRAPCRSTCETTICGSIRLSIVQTESRVTQIRTSEPATRICRAEVFNVLNHANFSHPELIVFSAMTSRARPGSFEKRRTASARSSSRYGSSSDAQTDTNGASNPRALLLTGTAENAYISCNPKFQKVYRRRDPWTQKKLVEENF